MTALLEIRLLGQFDVRRGGAPVILQSRPAQSLLAYLALNPGAAHRRERLAGLFWPDAADANARGYLRKALWQIRKSLAEGGPAPLIVDDIAITFDPSAEYWLDTAALAAPLPAGAPPADLAQALSVYQGELLPGFYDEWAVLERERLRALFETRMALLLERLAEERRWPETLEWGERWIALGGAPEPAYRALMSAHAALGDASKVAAVYERCVQALHADLGVEPSAQTRALYDRLVHTAGEPAAPPPAAPAVVPPLPVPPAAPLNRARLPAPLTSFIGREAEIAAVQHLLAEARLLTLTGAGGSGKTRLAIEVARAQAAAFAGGVCLVQLAALADPALVPQAVAAALDVPERPNQSWTDTLVKSLAAQHLLLVLDNCEHLVEACARLAEALVAACPRLTILASSREALGVAGERLFQVPTLSLPQPSHAGRPLALMQAESVRLFVERAAAVRQDFHLTEQNAAAVSEVCRRLDGIPLAIELAAARIPVLTVGQIAERLNDRFQLLTGGSRTALPRQQTLRAAIDWSHDLLAPAERTLFRRLAVFAGGWALEAAEAVCAGGEIEAAAVLDLLAQLANKSLVLTARQPGSEARYSLLETVREYAHDRMVEAGEAQALRDRHLQFFVHFAEAAEPRFFGREQGQSLARLNGDIDNLRAAMEWAIQQEPATAALRLVGATWWFWDVRGQQEGLQRALRAVALPAAQEQTAARAKALNATGHVLWVTGQPQQARSILLEALDIGRTLASLLDSALSLQLLGLVAVFERDYPAAEVYLEEGLELAQQTDTSNTYAIGEALAFRGDVALMPGDLERARRLYAEGVARLRELNDNFFLAYPLRRLGGLALQRGDLAQAAAYYEESLNLNLEIADERGVAMCLAAMAGLALARGQARRAAALLGAAEAQTQALQSTLFQADQADVERTVTALRAQLDQAAFAAAWAEGRALTMEQAVALAQAQAKYASTPAVPNNLPHELSNFIGRQTEIAEVQRLLAEARLVTLTGAGGSGKTRLAIEVARTQAAFADGVYLVELAALADPALVPQAVAAALEVREAPGRPLLSRVIDHLRARTALLVIDNCEHLVAACAELTETLLRNCAALKVLATSRETLNIAGERIFQVPSLSLPGPQDTGHIAALLQAESVRLFVERAAAVQSDFRLSEDNAAAVVEVCRRLDGIPLAIELAAARVGVMQVEQIAARLKNRFHLLTGGSRTALPRQQTLRAALDWSYDLLSPVEQAVLRRLAVFTGGWTLEAAEAVCADDALQSGDVSDVLFQLANKSLVLTARRLGPATRYRLLETVREYARDRLVEAEETQVVRDRHLQYFLRLAEAAEPQLFGPEQAAWFNLLEREHDNLRAAIEWSLESNAAAAALRLFGGLAGFWYLQSHHGEGLARLTQVLASPALQGRSAARAKGLNYAGFMHWVRGSPAEARRLLEEGLAIGRQLDSKINIVLSLQFLGLVATFDRRYAEARSYFEQAYEVGRALEPQDMHILGWSFFFQGDMPLHQGDYRQAQELYEQGVARLRQLGDKSLLAYPIRRLGYLALHFGEQEKARARFQESLTLNLALGDTRAIAACFVSIASLAAAQARAALAATLLAAAEAVLGANETGLLPADRLDYDRNLDSVRAQLDQAAFAAAWAEGRALTMEQAVALAQAVTQAQAVADD